MKLVKIDFSNYKIGIKIQNKIFTNEDGTINILASLDRNLFIEKTGINYIDDHVKYYLAEKDSKYVGITGLYNYNDDTENAWIAWYGILPQYRSKGLGEELLKETISLAKDQGFRYIRLYADLLDNADAIKLYEKNGFIKEKYTAEKLDYDCWVFSKSLFDEEVPLWNNKNLCLSGQSKLDHMSPEKIKEILNLYD
ncbi:MAG: GNAT family N-acetyltransferase [Erysipelotrichales bacterium]|nr:GNAT family N-acetyltransferase [Erysipelotrichales bacterium]